MESAPADRVARFVAGTHSICARHPPRTEHIKRAAPAYIALTMCEGASAAAVPGIETTQDIGTYFTGYGFDTDLASAAVDKVKIPKKWDDSFAAFNQIVQESGLDLADYKGKTVEKWTVLCPQLSTDDHDTYCVLLVYKAKAVGAYLLQKPSGEVTGLITAAKAGAEAASEEETVEISADAYPEE